MKDVKNIYKVLLQTLGSTAIGKSKAHLTAGYGIFEERKIRRKKGTRKAIIHHRENGTQGRLKFRICFLPPGQTVPKRSQNYYLRQHKDKINGLYSLMYCNLHL